MLCKKVRWIYAWDQASKLHLWFWLQFVLKFLPQLSFRLWPGSIKPNEPFLPQVAFCLVFMTAAEGRLEYPPLFFLIVTLFTYGFCQTCYITVPYLFCQGVCFTALSVILTAQPWWIYSLLLVWPIIVASHYVFTLTHLLLNFCGQFIGSLYQALCCLGWCLCFLRCAVLSAIVYWGHQRRKPGKASIPPPLYVWIIHLVHILPLPTVPLALL